jgi:hypothetical protein
MTRAIRTGAALALALASLAGPAAAQTGTPGGGRLELAAAASWVSPTALGAASANLTPNTGLTSFTLFSASADLAPAVAADATVGWHVSRAWTLSLTGGFSYPAVRVRIAGDAEGAADRLFTGERLQQWTIGGRADCDVLRWRFASGRVTPFLMAGAGYLRHVHEGRVSGVSGQAYQAGGGVRYSWLDRPASRLSRVRLTAELRAIHVRDGYHWGREARTALAVAGGVSTSWGRARKRGIMSHESSGRR